MKAVLDTNVLVSAIIALQGAPAQVLDAWRAHRFGLVSREDILDEIREVLCRSHIQKRHQWSQELIDCFVDDLEELATMTPGELSVQVIADDPDDDMYLACALEGEADYIVSGDQHLLKLGTLRGIRIVTPAQFLDILEGEC